MLNDNTKSTAMCEARTNISYAIGYFILKLHFHFNLLNLFLQTVTIMLRTYNKYLSNFEKSIEF